MKRCLIPILMLMLMLALGCGGPGKGNKPGPPPDDQAPSQEGVDRGPKAKPKELSAQERLDRRMNDLVKILELTPDQAGQIREILGKAEAQKQALEPEGGRWDSPDAMSRYYLKLRRVDLSANEELAKVLSKDQMEDYLDYVEDQRLHFEIKRNTGGPKRPGGGVVRPQSGRN